MTLSTKHRLHKFVSLLENGVQNQVFSGAQAALCSGFGDEITCANAGTTTNNGGNTVDENTLFDIASVTKVFTATSALVMADRKELNLHSTLKEFLPALSGSVKGEATVSELLAHEAKFRAWLPLFEEIPISKRGAFEAREVLFNGAVSSKSASDAVYSDLGFIALTQILELVSSLSLDRIIEKYVSKPMNLKSVHFRPIGGKNLIDHPIAATENCPWRERVLIGEVHDDNAWTMGGVSGHSGLFATAKDVARFGAFWLRARGGDDWISRDMASTATTRRSSGRGLGWDMVSEGYSSAGALLSRRSFGHLGFTGCTLWIDPGRNLSVALNTNHVHFGRDKEKIRAFRPAFHDMVAENWDGCI